MHRCDATDMFRHVHLRHLASGQGTLAKLDSKNPVLYIDFPTGRLKLIGTLLFPKTKYQLLRLGGKDVLCEDIFESVVSTCTMQQELPSVAVSTHILVGCLWQ